MNVIVLDDDDEIPADVEDVAEWRRAQARTRHIRSPDRTQSGDADLQQALEMSLFDAYGGVGGDVEELEEVDPELSRALAESARLAVEQEAARPSHRIEDDYDEEGALRRAMEESREQARLLEIPDIPTPVPSAGPSASNSGKMSLNSADFVQSDSRPLSEKAKGKRKAVEEIISVSSSSSSSSSPSPPPTERVREKTKEEIELENADTEDEEDEDGDIMMAGMTQSESQKSTGIQENAVADGNTESSPSKPKTTDSTPTTNANPLSLLFANRQRDEEARRARQAQWRLEQGKERLQSSEDEKEDDEQTVDQDEIQSPIMEEEKEPAKKRRKVEDAKEAGGASGSGAGSSTANPDARTTDGKKQEEKIAPADERFWDGEMRGVFNVFSHQRDRSIKSFNVKDILGDTSTITLLIAASYVWDWDWVWGMFPDPSRTPIVIVDQPQAERFNGTACIVRSNDIYPPGTAVCGAFLPGLQGAQHAKFMQIFYDDGRCRLVIMSGNMVPYDWETIENVAYVQDLPLNPQDISTLTEPTHQVARVFSHLFSRQVKIGKALKDLAVSHPNAIYIPLSSENNFASYDNWDWSRVKFRMVLSMAGSHSGDMNVNRVGLTGLSAELRAEGWVPGVKERVVAEFQSSSISGITPGWMSDMYKCFSGVKPHDILTQYRPKKEKGIKPSWPPLKIVYPSAKTFRTADRGPYTGTTTFCSQFNDDTKSLFYDANSKTSNAFMHTKMIIATFEPAVPQPVTLREAMRRQNSLEGIPAPDTDKLLSSADPDVGGWFYMGSHNFGPSAWGSLAREANVPRTYCNNYELGLILPLPRNDTQAAANEIATWQRPPRKYEWNDEAYQRAKHRDG